MNRVKQTGFTIIELMLAMAFVSALLIAVALTVIQIGNIYNQGLTLKDVNQAGRSLTSELQRDIGESMPFNIAGSGSSARYIKQSFGGRLCTGQYSYIWNYGSAIHNNNPSLLNTYIAPTTTTINFVRVLDPTANYCINPTTKIATSGATELLAAGEHTLAIHNFSISSASSAGNSATGQQLYSIGFTIGTNEYNNNQWTLSADASGNVSCLPPNNPAADPAYCAVAQFNIVALAGNIIQ